ncbi:VTDB protein, partial [Polypterus senegalus]
MDSAEDITYFRERTEDLSEEITMLAALLDSDVDETVFEIIEEQVERTLLHCSSGDAVPCSGRPSFDIPAESIEHLLLCGLKVQQIADLYDVSEKTITRRMSQFDIRVIASHSQKFSTAAFEEINALADGVVKLAEKCCAVGTDPNCYDDEATVISEKSCANTSGFPTHPGITECCKSEGLERKLCLADLRLPLEEFPALEETTNEEICQQFQKDPQTYGNSLNVHYGQLIPSASFKEVSPVVKYLEEGLAKCCSNPDPDCLMNEKSQIKEEMETFSTKLGGICESYHKMDFIPFKQKNRKHLQEKMPTSPPEEINRVAQLQEDFAATCCFYTAPRLRCQELVR